mmetsp:Transcript_22084/g.50483  ORF Transcript_22084/g.50483 Transcript_22084/m.50483 type:complete len:239 (+) Transcript_22084:515-1231(+)
MSNRSASTPASCKSQTCFNVAGFKFSNSGSCFEATRCMTHRMAENGSLTCAKGISIPTICASLGTSSRGKTTPGLSHSEVKSSNTSDCKVFVWPGVAFTLTTFSPMRLFTSDDLPTFGWPTSPMRIFAWPSSAVASSFSGFGVASPKCSLYALWQASSSAALPTGRLARGSVCSSTSCEPSPIDVISDPKAFEKPTTRLTPGMAVRRCLAQFTAWDADTVSSLLSTSTIGFCKVRLTW